MPAEKLRDPSYEIKLASGEEAVVGNRNTTLILDGEGRWCDIPCVSDTSTFLCLVKQYFKPRVNGEIRRLTQLQALYGSSPIQTKTVIGTGLFYYEQPNSGIFEEEVWKGVLAQSMRAAGLSVNPIPPHLFPSVGSMKDSFLNQEVDPLDYNPVSDLMTHTFVLCPALSRFESGYLSGKNLAIGYRAAIGVDGNALLGLLREDEIQTYPEFPGHSCVLTKTLMNAVKKVIE